MHHIFEINENIKKQRQQYHFFFHFPFQMKTKQQPPAPKKPGLTRQHLTGFYKILPDDGTLRNEHVLNIYCDNNK